MAKLMQQIRPPAVVLRMLWLRLQAYEPGLSRLVADIVSLQARAWATQGELMTLRAHVGQLHTELHLALGPSGIGKSYASRARGYWWDPRASRANVCATMGMWQSPTSKRVYPGFCNGCPGAQRGKPLWQRVTQTALLLEVTVDSFQEQQQQIVRIKKRYNEHAQWSEFSGVPRSGFQPLPMVNVVHMTKTWQFWHCCNNGSNYLQLHQFDQSVVAALTHCLLLQLPAELVQHILTFVRFTGF